MYRYQYCVVQLGNYGARAVATESILGGPAAG